MRIRILPFLFSILSLQAISDEIVSGPIGYYLSGSLSNGVELPEAGPGYMKLFTNRNRA